MKNLFKITIIIILFTNSLKSQTKVAILDFENTSGISKYDGFGKALSNMLITDLKNSIHPRKITFLERSQLNKILSEQNLQKTKNFDKSTAVSFGKLAGVKYVLVGSVYVMDGTCNITSRLVDVQTSEIVHAKESNGKITNWLSLKSILANELSTAMNNPVTIEAVYSKKETTEGVLTQYAKVIDKIDEGDVEGAQEMTEMLSSVQPDFKYFDELKLDIEELKKQVKENTEDIDFIKNSDPIGTGNDYFKNGDYAKAIKYFSYAKGQLDKWDLAKSIDLSYLIALSFQNQKKYDEAIINYNEILEIYPTFSPAVENIAGIYNITSSSKFEKFIEFQIDNIYNAGSVKYFGQSIHNYLSSILSKDSLEILQAKNTNLAGFKTNSSRIDGFGLTTSVFNFDQGYHFEMLLLNYTNFLKNNNLNPIEFLEKINLPKLKNSIGRPSSKTTDLKFIIKNPYYVPKSQYKTNSPVTNKYVFAKNGKNYNDYFHSKSDGTYWSEKTPSDCPCEKLLILEDYNKFINLQEKNDFANVNDINSLGLARTLGWYYLLNKRFNESENLYNSVIIYSNVYTFNYTGYTSIYKEFKSNPNDLTFIKLAPIIFKHRISDIKKMTVLNRIHLILLKGKVGQAIEAYKAVGLDNIFLDDWEGMSVFEVVKIDLNDFQKLGLIDEKTKNKVLEDLKFK
jgi:TolB-like protein